MRESIKKYLSLILAGSVLALAITLPLLHNHPAGEEGDPSCPAYVYIHSFSSETPQYDLNKIVCAIQSDSVTESETILQPTLLITHFNLRAPPVLPFS